MTEPAPAAPALPVRWRLLTILTASYGAGAFGMLGISPLSPSLVEGLGLTRFQVAFLVPSIYLSGLLFSMPGGRLADRRPLLHRLGAEVRHALAHDVRPRIVCLGDVALQLHHA